MHDIKFIRDNPKKFDEKMKNRNVNISSELILKIDKKNRELISNLQMFQEERNLLSKQIGILIKDNKDAFNVQNSVKKLKDQISLSEEKIKESENKLRDILINLPNILDDDVPNGATEDDNKVIRSWGEKTKFSFVPKDHVDLSKNNKLNFELGAKISGSRFVVIKNDLALMERALINFMLDTNIIKFGREEISPPYIVNSKSLFGTGQLPKFKDDLFETQQDKWLIPTSEVPLTNIVRDEILNDFVLPLNFIAYSPCFRSEAGAAGKDTRGMIRQHQFSKIEMVSIVHPKDSDAKLEEMTNHAEFILKELNLPYRVVLLCSGDTGFSSKKTYDIEVWLPGQNNSSGQYREISSCSNCGDFQSRRMNARFREKENKSLNYMHTLNGSCLAVGRTMIAIIENYQDQHGDVIIPEVLRPYMQNKQRIKLK
tara:strand:+ start:615 stop:1898 length:1284 start_codon:yes stop_codon:yes gene_type:complete